MSETFIPNEDEITLYKEALNMISNKQVIIQTIPDNIGVNYVQLCMKDAKEQAIKYINRIKDYSISQMDMLQTAFEKVCISQSQAFSKIARTIAECPDNYALGLKFMRAVDTAKIQKRVVDQIF